MTEKFDKSYKLCSHKIIDALFQDRKNLKSYPFYINYMETTLPTDKSLQFVISVPKKRFKRAVDRNRIKRLMKEAIRKTKWPLENYLNENKRQIAIFIVYMPQEELKYDFILEKMEQILTKFKNQIA
jgi:ribonuclease P protein component